MLLEDAGISTALTITPGQIVSVTGDRSLPQAPLWGSGTFTVQERGALTLNYVAIEGDLAVTGGGSMGLTACTGQLPGPRLGLTVTDSTFSMDASSTTTLGGSISLTNAGVVTLQDKTFNSARLAVGGGTQLSLSGCTGQLTGLTVTDSAFSMDASSTTTLGGSISLTNAGVVTLQDKTFEDGTSLTVGGGTQLSLSGCMLDASVSLTTNSGGSLSLTSMAVPTTVLGLAETQLSDASSTLRLSAVTLPKYPEAGELTGTMMVQADGSKTIDPADFGLIPAGPNEGSFSVTSGPCTSSFGGRCVGRPEGYGPSEDCEITVGGGGGVLADCGVFDTYPPSGAVGAYTTTDHITLPDGSTHQGSDCPVGVDLPPGGSVGWTSDGGMQGTPDCAAKGSCGLSWSNDGLGGGWQICFA